MAAHMHENVALTSIDPELLTNPTAVLATNGRDGHPQLTAVWYVIEDDQLCISVTESTRKARNLEANDRCAVLIFHPIVFS
jgi:nitroimidazol reductase NimA-like FMN-containing flavoprotein (pyridoxamine 5'-phosphate oxidase superfamily)